MTTSVTLDDTVSSEGCDWIDNAASYIRVINNENDTSTEADYIHDETFVCHWDHCE